MTVDPATDKLYDHNRQQLSAMMDGALAPDQARFLLRRLQHDHELAACWERWQVAGDVLRGHTRTMLPADFSQGVLRAIGVADTGIASDAHGAQSPSRRWRNWGGGAALAASVAVASLFVARQMPGGDAVDAPAQVVAATAVLPVSGTATENAAAPTSIPAADAAGALTGAIAAAQAPARATVRRNRVQETRTLARTARTPQAIPVLVAAGTGALSDPTLANAVPTPSSDPFGAQPVAPSRPWPRALLPVTRAVGSVTVDYANGSDVAAFHPFEPRLAADAASDAPSTEGGAPP